MKIKHLPLAIAAAISGQAAADTIQELEKTQVKSDKIESTVVSAPELELIQARDIKDILIHIPGVDVGNTLPYAQKVYIRGLEEHAANVTIDGARQDGQLFHHSATQMVDASILQAVEVSLGASSVLSGYGAITGAIDYQTKDPEDLLSVGKRGGFKVDTGFDSATDYRQRSVAGYGKVTDQLSVLARFNQSETGDLEIPGSEPIVSKHSELDNGLVKLVYRIDDAQKLRLNLQRYEDSGNRDFSGEKPGSFTLEEQLDFNGYKRNTYTLSYENNSDHPALDLKINAYYNEKALETGPRDGRWYRDSNGDWQDDGDVTIRTKEYVYRTTGLDIRNTSVVGDVAWTYGIESFNAEQVIESAGPTLVALDNGGSLSLNQVVNNGPEQKLISGYVQAEINVGDWQLVPGIRYDKVTMGGTYDSSFGELSPKFHASWQATKDFNLYVGYGRIFKTPNLPETYYVSNSLSESADISDQSGNQYEIRANYDLTAELGVDRADLFVNLYRYNLDNYSHPTKNTALTADRDLEMQGVEAGLNITSGKLAFSADYSFADGDNHHHDGFVFDTLNTGTHLFKFRTSYQLSEGLQMGWDTEFAKADDLINIYDWRGTRFIENVEKKGYGVSRLWVNYIPTQVEGVRVRFAIDNIFDKRYQNHNTFGNLWGESDYNDNEIGRNFALSVGYQY